MKRTIVFGIFVVASLAFPALAQGAGAVIDAVPTATQSLLGQGITGTIALLCLVGIVFKDREIARERKESAALIKAERDAAMEKLLALALARAADAAANTDLVKRVERHLDKGSAP